MKTKVFLCFVLVILISENTLAQENAKRSGFELSSG
jgi:hypothetical protein